jgi:hypothetical protein
VLLSTVTATTGKLLNCTLPPDCGHPESHFIPLVHDPVTLQRLPSQRTIAPPPAGSLPPPSSTGPASTSFASTTAGASRSSGQGSSRAAAGAPQQAAGGSSGAYATTHVSSQVGVNEAALEDGQSEEGTSEGSEDGTDDESGAVGGPSSSQQQQPAAMLGDLDEADLDLLLGDLGGGSGGPGECLYTSIVPKLSDKLSFSALPQTRCAWHHTITSTHPEPRNHDWVA